MKLNRSDLNLSEIARFSTGLLSLFLTLLIAVGCGTTSNNSNASWLKRDAIVASGTGSSSAIKLAWKSQTITQFYSIFRSIDPNQGFQPIGATENTSFTDSDVNSGQVYYYRVASSGTTADLSIPIQYDGGTVRAATADCFSKDNIRQLKSLRSVTQLRKSLTDLYASCSTVLSDRLKIEDLQPLSDSELKMVYAMIVAHLMAPYGPSTAMALTDLLADNVLDCDNYAALTGDIYQLLAGDNYSESIYFAGFNGGAVGNHAQILFVSSLRQMMIDPTVGIVAIINFSDLLAGVPTTHIYSFYGYWDDPAQQDNLGDFHWMVYDAIYNGFYKPEDVYYFSPRVKDFTTPVNENEFVAFPGT